MSQIHINQGNIDHPVDTALLEYHTVTHAGNGESASIPSRISTFLRSFARIGHNRKG